MDRPPHPTGPPRLTGHHHGAYPAVEFLPVALRLLREVHGVTQKAAVLRPLSDHLRARVHPEALPRVESGLRPDRSPLKAFPKVHPGSKGNRRTG